MKSRVVIDCTRILTLAEVSALLGIHESQVTNFSSKEGAERLARL